MGVRPSKAWRRGVALLLGRAQPDGDADLRLVAVGRGAATALAARGLSLLTSFVAVPLTVAYLGTERYGAWVTIGSTVGWLSIADFGLANSLTTALAEALGQEEIELARQYVATAFWLLCGVALLCGLALGLFSLRTDWAAVLNVHGALAREEVRRAVPLAAALFLLGFPLTLVERVYAACHQGSAANGWTAAASLASLAGLVLVTRGSGGLPLLVLAFSGCRLWVQALSALWLFSKRRPDLRPAPSAVRRAALRRVSFASSRFFVIQAAALVLFGSDNFIIARVLGPDRVTPYSVTWSLFTLPPLAMTLAFPYLWPAYASAIARRDGRWVRRSFHASIVLALGSATAVALPLAVFGRPLIAAWAGPAAVPAPAVLLWMAVWSVVNAVMNAVSCLLNAAEQIGLQAACAAATAGVNVVLSILWGRAYGLEGVIAATVVSYALTAVIPLSLDAARVLRRLQLQPAREA